MPQRHTIPPESEKEQFIFGLNGPQLMWAAGGIAISFGGFFLLSKIQESVWTSLLFGIPPGFIVLPFIFYRPKKGTLSFGEFLRYKYTIKKRNNELPNKRSFVPKKHDEDVEVLSPEMTESKKDVRNVDIRLGGGS